MNACPIISIVVPVYKAEDYLECCIDSILAQSFVDFELLLINDGSPDCSGKICEEYAKKDKRIRTFHQENRGVSAARNKGLQEVCGQYLTFIDSDDWVGVNYLKDLYDALPNHCQRGVVIEGVVKVYQDRKSEQQQLMEKCLSSSDIYCVLTEQVDRNIGYSASKLYNVSLIREKQLLFSEKISLLEDMIFLLDYIIVADFVKITNISHYFYRTSHSPMALSVYINSFEKEYAVFQVFKERIETLQQIYSLQNDQLDKVWGALKCYFHRSILSLYSSSNSYRYNIRRMALKKMVHENKKWMAFYFSPDYKTDRVTRQLLLHGCYTICDFWMKFLIMIKCKYMFGG